jgi:hypothetical protein
LIKYLYLHLTKKPLYFQSIMVLVLTLGFALKTNAQVDAGALQQGLEKQMPLPSPLPLPSPVAPEQKRSNEGSAKEAIKLLASHTAAKLDVAASF